MILDIRKYRQFSLQALIPPPVYLCVCVSTGDLPSEGGGEQRDGVRHAPYQCPRSGGHVHTGRAARSRHHAQPVSALPER